MCHNSKLCTRVGETLNINSLIVRDTFVASKLQTAHLILSSSTFHTFNMHILKAKQAQTRTSAVSHVCQKVVS